jgi:nucleotide-binding universal stress UspA family protein
MRTAFRKIVIGIDFSDASLAAATWAATHIASDAELLLVHVVPLPRPPIYLHERIGATVEQRSVSAPRLYTALQGFADLLGAGRVRVGVRTGVPWSALARVAGEVKADLICVGRGQKRKGSNRFGATTPQRLLGISRIPVLVIPQGVTEKPSRVFAALSARPGGERVIPVAGLLAKMWGSRLEGIHVVEPEISPGSNQLRVPTAINQIDNASVQRVRRTGIDALDPTAVRTLASEWAAAAISAAGETDSTEPIIRSGDAGQELVTVARERPGISLVVMGRTGESVSSPSLPSQFRCGSTTRMVLWAAPGPVLIVPLESAETYTLPLDAPIRGLDTRLRPQTAVASLSVSPTARVWQYDGPGAA